MPEISVIIPTYSRPVFLDRAIKSVLNQTCQNFEIIVVDDNNEGDIYRKKTEDVMSQFLSNKSIVYIKHIKNSNASAARNTGIKYARGEYIAFLDDDDTWYPDKLSIQLSSFKTLQPDYAMVSCNHIFNVNGKKTEKVHECSGDMYETLLLKNWIGSTSLPLIKKKALLSVGLFDTRLESSQDLDLWIRLIRNYKVLIIDEFLVEITIHGDQITSQLEKKIAGQLQFVEKYSTELEKFHVAKAKHLYSLGFLYAVNKDVKKSRRFFLKSLSYSPLNLRCYIHLILSIVCPYAQRFLIHRYGLNKMENHTLY